MKKLSFAKNSYEDLIIDNTENKDAIALQIGDKKISAIEISAEILKYLKSIDDIHNMPYAIVSNESYEFIKNKYIEYEYDKEYNEPIREMLLKEELYEDTIYPKNAEYYFQET